MRIRFDEVDGFIRARGDKFRHLVLFEHGLFDKICDKIKYLTSEKVVLQIILIIILEKLELTHIFLYLLKKCCDNTQDNTHSHNVIILIKSVVNKDKNNYYYISL